MKTLNPEYAKTGLMLVVLAWVFVLLAEVVSNSDRLLLAVARGALLAGLVVGVLKGNRTASALLVGWSIVALSLSGFWLTLFLMAAGVGLYLWAGGSRAFRVPSPVAASSELPER